MLFCSLLFEILLVEKQLFPFTSIQNQYRFEGTGFPTIPQLIEHHYTTKQVITKKSGVVLLNPVVKVNAYIPRTLCN